MIVTFGVKNLIDIYKIANYAAGFGCQVISIHKDEWAKNSGYDMIAGYRIWINAINGILAREMTQNIDKQFKNVEGYTAEVKG